MVLEKNVRISWAERRTDAEVLWVAGVTRSLIIMLQVLHLVTLLSLTSPPNLV